MVHKSALLLLTTLTQYIPLKSHGKNVAVPVPSLVEKVTQRTQILLLAKI